MIINIEIQIKETINKRKIYIKNMKININKNILNILLILILKIQYFLKFSSN